MRYGLAAFCTAALGRWADPSRVSLFSFTGDVARRLQISTGGASSLAGSA